MASEGLHEAARLAEALFSGREVAAVHPVERSGLRLAFRGARQALVLDTIPPPGRIVPVRARTPRLKGGRGAWPDAAGLADRELQGTRLDRVLVEPDGRGVSVVLSDRSRLILLRDRRSGARIELRLADGRVRTLPEQVPAGEEPGDVAWIPASDTSGRVDGADAGRLERAWLDDRAAWIVGARREAAEGLLRREERRVRRALSAVARDERRAGDAAQMRRQAEALLAAPPGLVAVNERYAVPDPYAPERTVDVVVQPPGARPAEVANRLFAKARREGRGIVARAKRTRQLEEQLRLLRDLLERAKAATTDDELAEVELDASGVGVSFAGAARRAGTRARPQPERPTRAFRSPSGFEVLAGRSARQNDRLTFRVASPEDLWLHVRDRPGAHVILRTGGKREVPERDVVFAARVAAAFCRAPDGESVEVHVARRKHVRKPRGAPHGQVLVRRSRTIAVRVESAPDSS